MVEARCTSSGLALPGLADECLFVGVTQTRRGSIDTSGFDPNVWSGRAVQEVFIDLANAVLHQCMWGARYDQRPQTEGDPQCARFKSSPMLTRSRSGNSLMSRSRVCRERARS